MSFKCGLIGLPNVGKSTLFNALTKARIQAANFPFCTIEPNIGVVSIHDPRIDQIKRIVKPQRIVPTTIEFIDIAGLVRGASKGEGLGNRFLSHIRTVEAIGHIVRCFKNDHIIHLGGQVDPKEDINTINTELALSDLEACERAIYRMEKYAKGGDKDAKKKLLVLGKCLNHLNNSGMLRTLDLSNNEKSAIRYLGFLTLKPTMYIANINENGLKENPYLNEVLAIALAEGGAPVVPVCATLESDITELSEEERHEFMIELSFQESALNRIIQVAYRLLNLQTYFTAGLKEVRAWTIPNGISAQKAAGKIHTDFEKGFIRAQTISFADFVTYQGISGAKEAGKMRFEGKDYLIEDGDVINFLFNV